MLYHWIVLEDWWVSALIIVTMPCILLLIFFLLRGQKEASGCAITSRSLLLGAYLVLPTI